MENNYYALYDLEDNLICLFNNIHEFVSKHHYQYFELRRKFKKSKSNYINLELEKKSYKLYKFS